MAAGRLSADHVDLLATAERRAPCAYAKAEAEAKLKRCSSHSALVCGSSRRPWSSTTGNHADPDGTPPDPTDNTTAHASETIDGTMHVTAYLHGLGAHHFVTELDRLADLIRLEDDKRGLTRTAAQRRGAALLEMAKRSASTPAGAQPPKPLFTALLGDDTFRHRCETSTRRVIPVDWLTPHVDDAVMEVVSFATPTTVVAKSHRRSFTGPLRRAIEVRDRHCQHPCGCDIDVERCDVDHLLPWIDGGDTSQHNGRLECRGHNRHHHLHDQAEPQPADEPIADLEAVGQRWRQHLPPPDEPDHPPDELTG